MREKTELSIVRDVYVLEDTLCVCTLMCNVCALRDPPIYVPLGVILSLGRLTFSPVRVASVLTHVVSCAVKVIFPGCTEPGDFGVKDVFPFELLYRARNGMLTGSTLGVLWGGVK